MPQTIAQPTPAPLPGQRAREHALAGLLRSSSRLKEGLTTAVAAAPQQPSQPAPVPQPEGGDQPTGEANAAAQGAQQRGDAASGSGGEEPLVPSAPLGEQPAPMQH